MELFIVRHGVAQENSEFRKISKNDSLRPLIPIGKNQTRNLAKFLRKKIKTFDLIVTSSLVRSLETAEILNKFYSKSPLVLTGELAPGVSSIRTLNWIQKHCKKMERVLLVGHEPELSVLICFLLTGKRKKWLKLNKSGLVVLELGNLKKFRPGKAELRHLLQPNFSPGK